MTNVNKLRGRLAEIGMTLSDFAEKMGLSRPTARKKVDGETQFLAAEIKRACDILEIPLSEIETYFFSN
jgi:transcriptional regulator with XRE-family HTH domain